MRSRLFCRYISLVVSTLISVATISPAQQEGASQLPAEAIARAKPTELSSIPTPGELFAAIEKSYAIEWSSFQRPLLPNNLTDRPQIACAIGIVLADGYVIAQAQNAQEMKNLSRDLVTLCRTLGIAEEIMPRAARLTDLAANDVWTPLHEEMHAARREIERALETNRDNALIPLLLLGEWIRGNQIVISLLLEKTHATHPAFQRQPTVITAFRQQLAILPARKRSLPHVIEMGATLAALQPSFSKAPHQSLTREELQHCHHELTQLVNLILERPVDTPQEQSPPPKPSPSAETDPLQPEESS